MKTKTFTAFIVMAMLFLQMADAQHEDYLIFDASYAESYARTGVLDQLNYSAFTVEFWVNLQEFTNDNYMVCNEGYSTAEEGFTFRTSEAGDRHAPRFGIGTTAGWDVIDGPDNLILNTWTHLAAVVDGLQVTLYVNGVEVNSKTLGAAPSVSQQTLTFGEGSMWTNRRMAGFLSDCRIWNVARTQQQIAENKDAYLTTTSTDLLANWKMDEGSGTTIADFAGNYPGTLQSGVTWASVTGIVDGINNSRVDAIYSSLNSALILNNYESESSGFRIYNTAGQGFYNGRIGAYSQKEINISDLPAGIYIVIFDYGQKQIPIKFIKK